MSSFRTILVGADFSAQSTEAFRVACGLAEPAKTRLIVLHVVELPVAFGEMGMPMPLPEVDPAEREALKARLRQAYAPDRPIDVEYRVGDGVPVEEVLRAADESGADLLALGTHGRTGLGRLLAGSVAEAILRRAHCPVLALHAREGARPEADAVRLILHPTDFSDRAEAALVVARALARDHGARLVLLHVEPIEVLEGAMVPVDPRAYLEPMAELRAKVEGPDLKHPPESRCEQGDPANEIVRVAADLGCDLIVLGTHGRGGLGRLLMGSVAEEVLRRATCPTLIVKPSRPAPAGAPAESGREAVTIL
jgi:nucleotide-binding universal stress UspA family protein